MLRLPGAARDSRASSVVAAGRYARTIALDGAAA